MDGCDSQRSTRTNSGEEEGLTPTVITLELPKLKACEETGSNSSGKKKWTEAIPSFRHWFVREFNQIP